MVYPLSTTQNPPVAIANQTPAAPADNTITNSSFDAILSSYLNTDSQDQVNEEQLFAALIGERLSDLKGSAIQERYRELLEKEKIQHAGGAPAEEETARAALKSLAETGALSMEEAEKIHAEAFKAAQLDDNLDVLYDGRGSALDPTIAVMQVDSAIESARAKIEAFEAGEDAGRLSLDLEADTSAVSEGSASGGGGTTNYPAGFVFKPVSERDGHLAVLLPSSMAGDAREINLLDKNGHVLEHGDSYGTYEDGRPLFRFARPGSGYPDALHLQIVLNSGDTEEYFIPDPSRRYG